LDSLIEIRLGAKLVHAEPAACLSWDCLRLRAQGGIEDGSDKQTMRLLKSQIVGRAYLCRWRPFGVSRPVSQFNGDDPLIAAEPA
jgi:hypothetical protein